MNSNNNEKNIKGFYEFVKTSFAYYDQNYKINFNININNKKYELVEKNNTKNIVIYNADNEIILKDKYQIIGVFNRNKDIFNWAWSIPNIDNDLIQYSKEILNYGLGLSKEHIVLRSLLTKTDITTESELFEDFIMSIVSYLLKIKIIFRIVFDVETKYKLTLICIR